MNSCILIGSNFKSLILLNKKIFNLFFLFMLLSKLTAQSGTIQGNVIDKEYRQPIEFASVSVLKTGDSTIVSGVLTKENGAFNINGLDVGQYILNTYILGYQSTYSNFSITDKGQQINIGNIEVTTSNKFLEEVTVTAKKNSFTNKLDKQTFRADQFEAAKGGNATDVLKNLPSVSVNSFGEISLRGSTGFLILINGKPVLTDAQSLLNQLPANTIENIELITAPTAKYDADGKAGIININTKKGTTDGIALQTNFQLGLPSTTDYNNLESPLRFGVDATLSHRNKKWENFVSINYNRNDTNGERVGEVSTKNFTTNRLTSFPSYGERSFDRYNYGLRTGLSYAADKNNVFSIGIFVSKKFQDRRADIVYNNTTSDLTSGAIFRRFDYFNSNVQSKEVKFGLGSLDYAHTFKNNSKLTTTAIYEYADLYGNTVNRNLDYPAEKILLQEVTNPYKNPIKGYRLKVDYSTNIAKGKLEAGYQLRNDNQNGTFDYNITPASNQTDITKFRGTAKSSNTINALYTQFSNKINKLQYVAGLRYEVAKREVNLSSDASPHLLNLSNVFPSINLQYEMNASWSAKAGYSKRVQRNSNFELNPIPEREHSETLEQGDPDLLPQFIDLAELGVTNKFEKGSFFSTLYFQNIKNPIQRVNNVYADTILNRLFTNAGNARVIGLEVGSNYSFTKRITSYLGTNIYNYKINGELDVLGTTSMVNNADWVYSINMNTTFDLGQKWSLQTSFNYLSNRPTAQGEDSRFYNPNIALKKSSKDNRISIGLLWQNMNLGLMNSNQQRITTYGNDFYTTTNYIYETDVFLVNFSFNLNKLTNKIKVPTSELGEKEF
jgi:ferric enterobactin receptor